MSATLTLTGTAGPAVTVTAAVFTNIQYFTVDTNQNTVTFKSNDTGQIQIISVAAAATVTATKSGSLWTLTIS